MLTLKKAVRLRILELEQYDKELFLFVVGSKIMDIF